MIELSINFWRARLFCLAVTSDRNSNQHLKERLRDIFTAQCSVLLREAHTPCRFPSSLPAVRDYKTTTCMDRMHGGDRSVLGGISRILEVSKLLLSHARIFSDSSYLMSKRQRGWSLCIRKSDRLVPVRWML